MRDGLFRLRTASLPRPARIGEAWSMHATLASVIGEAWGSLDERRFLFLT